MKRNIYILFFLLLIGLQVNATNTQTVYAGKVTCMGQGIEGVMVTDGKLVCVTDRKGKYSMPVNPDARFVYISSPSGYTVPVINSVPRFFYALNKNEEKVNSIDFVLEKSEDTRHGFVVWADPQVKSDQELLQLKEVAGDLDSLLNTYPDMPFHGIGCGDISGDNPEIYDGLKSTLASTGIPFYQSMGNHDMSYNDRSNELATSIFEKHFGPAYYSFNRGDIHYVVLNDVFYLGRDYFYIGYLSEEQLDWLEKDLSLVKEGSTVVVAFHIPSALNEEDLKAFTYKNISLSMSNRKALYNLLKPYQAHIVSGHMHENSNVIIAPNIMEHNVSSVCGAWWQGPYAEDGTPKGYAVFEANGSELKWYFKSAGKPVREQFRAYACGTNPEQPEYLTANVWNWDPEWKVYWYENGQKMGEMESYRGGDPETNRAYADKDKLAYKWVSSRPTNHMFRAKVQNPQSSIRIEVVDRFGQIYQQDVNKN